MGKEQRDREEKDQREQYEKEQDWKMMFFAAIAGTSTLAQQLDTAAIVDTAELIANRAAARLAEKFSNK